MNWRECEVDGMRYGMSARRMECEEVGVHGVWKERWGV